MNGKMTLIVDSGKGLLTLQPSHELLDSTRDVSLHGHLYDLQHRYNNTELGQSTICWAYHNHRERGGHCARDDYDCQTLTGVENWPWTSYGYSVDWYQNYIRTVAREKGQGWWFMHHSAGGHFATDENGHLIEWDGSPFVESSFYGRNSIRPDRNARVGRTLTKRDFGLGDKCNRMLEGVLAEEYFLDENGVSWVDGDGKLTEDAIAHGYNLGLAGAFMMNRYNLRTDEYGGSLENRVRLFREIIEDTKDAVGDTMGVVVRFSVDELRGSEGLEADKEGREIVEMLAELPDLWDVNIAEWHNDSMTSRFADEGYQEPFIDFVKKVTSKPVVAVGRYTTPDRMASIIKKGIVDMIGAARPSIADPFLPRKIEEGRIEEIRECIGCNICVAWNNMLAPMRCTQNPTASEEWRRGLRRPSLRP